MPLILLLLNTAVIPLILLLNTAVMPLTYNYMLNPDPSWSWSTSQLYLVLGPKVVPFLRYLVCGELPLQPQAFQNGTGRQKRVDRQSVMEDRNQMDQSVMQDQNRVDQTAEDHRTPHSDPPPLRRRQLTSRRS